MITACRVLAVLFILAALSGPVAAQESPEHYLKFVRHLLEEGDYYRAVTEAKRFIFLRPKDPRVVDAQFLIARAYVAAGQYKDARTAFRPVVMQRRRPDITAKAIIELGRCLEQIDPRRDAPAYYKGLTTEPSLPAGHAEEIRNVAWYRLGWLYLEAGRWRESKDAFDRVDGDHRLAMSARDLARRAPEGESLNYRSPAAAGVMSGILPGSGQLYVGRPVDAGLAFALNAAFLCGAIEAYNDENWAIFALLSLMEIGWYGGNIYNAVNGAHIHNREEKAKFLKKMHRDHGWRVEYNPKEKGAVLSWTVRY